MRNFIIASLALAAALAAPAAAQTVKLLANHTHLATGNPGNNAQVQATVGPYATDALVLVSAQGGSRFDGGTGTSNGISVEIVANGLVLQDDSFEGTSHKIRFRAAVSHSFVLKRGVTRVVKARTRPYGSGAGSNTPTSVSMDLAAIAVSP